MTFTFNQENAKNRPEKLKTCSTFSPVNPFIHSLSITKSVSDRERRLQSTIIALLLGYDWLFGCTRGPNKALDSHGVKVLVDCIMTSS